MDAGLVAATLVELSPVLFVGAIALAYVVGMPIYAVVWVVRRAITVRAFIVAVWLVYFGLALAAMWQAGAGLGGA